MVTKFKLSDVVKDRYHGIGTVVEEDDGEGSVGIDFGESFPGHNLGGVIITTTGWWCDKNNLSLYKVLTKEERIIEKVLYLQKKFNERKKK